MKRKVPKNFGPSDFIIVRNIYKKAASQYDNQDLYINTILKQNLLSPSYSNLNPVNLSGGALVDWNTNEASGFSYSICSGRDRGFTLSFLLSELLDECS